MVGEGLIHLIIVDEDRTLDPVPLTADRQCIVVIGLTLHMIRGTTLEMIAITGGAAIDLFPEVSHQEEEDTLGAAIRRGGGGVDTPLVNLQNLGEGQGRAIVAPREARGGVPSGAIQGIDILLGGRLRGIVLVQVPERYQGLIRQGPHHLQLNQCFRWRGICDLLVSRSGFVHVGCVLIISNC